MRKTTLFILALSTALLAIPVDAKEVDPTVLAPADTSFYISVTDVSKMETDWSKTGLSQLWSDKQVQRFTKPMRDWVKMKFEEGKAEAAKQGAIPSNDPITWARFKEYFPGAFSFMLTETIFFGASPQGCFTIAAKANPSKTRKDYEEFIAKYYPDMPEPGSKKRTFKVGNVTVYETEKKLPEEFIAAIAAVAPEAVASARTSAIQFAMVDGWILMTDGTANTLRDMILRHTGKRDDSLAASANYRSAMKRSVAKPQFGVYVNLELLSSGFIRSMSAMGAIDPAKFDINVLHLEDIKGLAWVFGFNDKAIGYSLKIALAPSPRGVAEIVKSLWGGTCSFKSAALAPKEVITYSASGASLGPIIISIIDLVKAASPEAGPQIDMMLTTGRMMAGFDPITEIVEQIEGEICSMSVAKATPDAAGGTDDIFMLGLKDGARVEAAFKKIEQMMLAQQAQMGGVPESPFVTSQFLGFTIYSIKPNPNAGMMAGPQPTFCWVFSKSWALLSTSPDVVKQTLRRMTQRDGGSFADSPVLKRIRSQHGSNLCGMSYVDLPEVLLLLCLQGQQIAPMASMITQGAVPANILDFAAMPDKALFEKYLGSYTSVALSEPDGVILLDTIGAE